MLSHSSPPHTLSMEETMLSSEKEILELKTGTATAPVVKACKAPKPGEKASLEAIKSWRENGFSRSIYILVYILSSCIS